MGIKEYEYRLALYQVAVTRRTERLEKSGNPQIIALTSKMLNEVADFLNKQQMALEPILTDEVCNAHAEMKFACIDFLIAAYDEFLNGVNEINKKEKEDK